MTCTHTLCHIEYVGNYENRSIRSKVDWWKQIRTGVRNKCNVRHRLRACLYTCSIALVPCYHKLFDGYMYLHETSAWSCDHVIAHENRMIKIGFVMFQRAICRPGSKAVFLPHTGKIPSSHPTGCHGQCVGIMCSIIRFSFNGKTHGFHSAIFTHATFGNSKYFCQNLTWRVNPKR